MPTLLVTLASLAWAADAPAPEKVLLWPKGAPGAVGTNDTDKPSLTIYLPPADKAIGTAIVVCPGGGYGTLAQHEGKDVPQEASRPLHQLLTSRRVIAHDIPPREYPDQQGFHTNKRTGAERLRPTQVAGRRMQPAYRVAPLPGLRWPFSALRGPSGLGAAQGLPGPCWG